MDFELPDDIKEFCDVTRAIVRDLLPYETEFQATGKVPPIVRQTLVDNGYFGLSLPEEYGGLGLGALAQAADRHYRDGRGQRQRHGQSKGAEPLQPAAHAALRTAGSM